MLRLILFGLRHSTKMFLTSVAFALSVSLIASAAPNAADPCVKVAGKPFVLPADALACLKSFPFNETLRQNVIATGVLYLTSLPD